jgi:signal transduction histidine kinase/ligand-binding sensor domain-containing protein
MHWGTTAMNTTRLHTTPLLRACGPSLFALVFLLFICLTASALSREGKVVELRHTGWGAVTGAPSGSAIVQTRDGYMWLGSADGLFRFDGLKFERIDLPRGNPDSSRNVLQLFAAPTGGLWIGLAFGGAMLLKDGAFTTYSVKDGLPPGAIFAFAQGPDGTVWAGAEKGLARFNGSRWQEVASSLGIPAKDTFSLMVDSAETVWAATSGALFALYKGQPTFQPVPVQGESDYSFAESADGAVWLWDEAGLRQIARNPNPRRQTASSGRNFIFDRDGGLWIKGIAAEVRRLARPESVAMGTAVRYEDVADVFGPKQGLAAGPGPTTLAEDREGNVWLFGSGGVDRFSERRLTQLQTDLLGDGVTVTPIDSGLAAAADGGIWIAQRGEQGRLYRVHEGRFTRHEAIPDVSAVLRAKDGSLWLGGVSGFWHNAAGAFERIAVPPQMEKQEVQALTEDSSGAIWVQFGRSDGTFRFADGVWTAKSKKGVQPGSFYALATDQRGRVWGGQVKGRIAILEDPAGGVVPRELELPVGTVTAIYGLRQNVWAGGDLGLARLDGETFRAVLPEPGKEFGSITGIVETLAGDLWFNGSGGISRISAEEVRRVVADPTHRVKVELLDLLDGVAGTSARIRPLPTLIEATDGQLWFVTSAGIYWLNPAKLMRNPLPPPVQIQVLSADGADYAVRQEMALPARTKSLQLNYVGLSLTQPERVRYRYQLEGFESSWQDAQSRREAFYTNLEPGRYRFQVTAANNDGIWNTTGATLDFTIPPAFTQTRAFIALCVLAATAVVLMLVQLRIRQVAARLRGRQQERLDERERIARELHDTLLQSTEGLVLRFQAVANRLDAADPTRTMLEKTLARADEVMAEGRDRVQDLRTAANTRTDLRQAFDAEGLALSQGRAVAFATVVMGRPRELAPGIGDESFRIGCEALVNAFSHARAGSIGVELVYAKDEFRVVVADDGVGMAPDVLAAGARAGHWGLKGMHERAERMKGQLIVRARPAGGTEVVLSVASGVAYARVRRSAWWQRASRHSKADS